MFLAVTKIDKGSKECYVLFRQTFGTSSVRVSHDYGDRHDIWTQRTSYKAGAIVYYNQLYVRCSANVLQNIVTLVKAAKIM